jgi:hypothetical protein
MVRDITHLSKSPLILAWFLAINHYVARDLERYEVNLSFLARLFVVGK